MSDGTLIEVDITFTAEFQKNPKDHEAQNDDGSSDGWVITDVSLA